MERGLRRARRRRLAVAIVAAVVAALPSGVWAQSPRERHVVVLRVADHDARPSVASEAIAFWNRVLTELQLRTRLVETTLTTTSRSERILENYTREVWQQAGRLSPGGLGPKEPRLGGLGADVIVFLSRQPTMSFAWPLLQSRGFFVAVPSETATRNIIAHELGHALGLTHHDDPRVLMCSPCQEGQLEDDGSFLPLTRYDRLRLRELHSAAP
jgi:hypothetical protein